MWGKAPWQHGQVHADVHCRLHVRGEGDVDAIRAVSVWPLLLRPIRPSRLSLLCITTPMALFPSTGRSFPAQAADFGSGHRPSVRVSEPRHVLEPSHNSPQNLFQIHLVILL
ncbi:hypothetical protein J3458_000933 [Metarhizium acridum]|uniref:uncharacterized protein n=1 Tax=Metarhizium acridum TaxID=92637 RepID=UPI001C6B4160|nr:hypothetical protein J3458_000933 [Metarhizium acridum]